MLNKLSLKVALIFFVFIMIVEVLLFSVLYTNLVSNQVDEVLEGLLARGSSHRDVLEKSFDDITLNHVALMETEAATDVIITGKNGEVLSKSTEATKEIIQLIDHENSINVSHAGKVIEDRWRTAPYIATLSPIVIDGELVGQVYMFSPSDAVQNVVNELTRQFVIIGLLTVLLTIITIFILTRFLTLPLIHMKQVTERMSTGETDISLETTSRKDELGELASAIQTLASELEHLKRDRNDFLANIAHELRTPLTYIKGYADIAGRSSLSMEERGHYLDILKEESEQLTLLVKNLFALAKMDQNQFSIAPEQVKLCDSLEKVVKRLHPVFDEKKVMLDLNCPMNVEAFVDPERFQQIMLNLLDNALKHSPAGATIRISSEMQQGVAVVHVSDEGSGIPVEELPFIFDRLYRVDKSRSRASGGSGLGLAIVKEIIRLHDGKINVKSRLGEGTTFMMELPGGKNNG
ncbi:Signal transduction histidine kinase [Thalassobacillus cyri]|uniref:histidine kinase n=1 Tax=Thalassobacillus cyri TaxID=571932 RepID=A0A1H4AWZ1_9BACI|nr:ATP-binding protein [Thalassobacillus cyri]SEA40380.1 Signal transduction histidine kinase [Thalassobacillus cyri]